MKALELVCGDPEEATSGASYSRFVIPFAYRKQVCDASGGGDGVDGTTPPYEYVFDRHAGSKSPANDWRRNYLTSETEAVLFEKAKWYRLQGKGGDRFRRDFTIKINGKAIAACLSAPLLILFECPPENSSGRTEDSWDILQVAFLVVEIFFPDNQEEAVVLDDFLKINELFRYFEKPYEGHFADRELRHFIALDSFGLPTTASNETLDDPRPFYGRWWHLIDGVPIQGKRWKIERATYEKHSADANSVRVKAEGATESDEGVTEQAKNTYPDNRAFVWTCAILPAGAKHLWQMLTPRYWKASTYSHWIKLLNVDYPFAEIAGDTYRSNEFERDWAEERTYHRWEASGTYYGFTPHRGAALAPQMCDPPIWRHFGDMYFDQVLLLLYLRVELFRFSAKLSEISRDARNPNGAEGTWAKEFQDLRWHFTLFTNLYQFPLLSNQQQGIELYSLARQSMEIDGLFAEVKEQIHNSDDYLAQEQERRQTQEIGKLTIETTALTREIAFLTLLAVIISVILFTVALFTMPFFEEAPWVQSWAESFGRFMTFLAWLVISLVLVGVCLRLRKRLKRWYNRFRSRFGMKEK